MRFCSIRSGSNGNCIYIGSDNTHLLIDTGLSGKKIEAGLNELGLTGEDIDGILVTHEHSDHISGLGVFSRKYGTPVYTTAGTHRAISSKKLGDLSKSTFTDITCGESFYIGDLLVKATSVSHDAAEPCAFRIFDQNKSAGVLTDLGCYDEIIKDDFSNMDVLLLEANHDVNMLRAGRYTYELQNRILSKYGHLSNETGGQLLDQLLCEKTKHVFLGHLSEENNYPALALESVKLEVNQGPGAFCASDFPIEVASRNAVSACIEF